MRTWCEEKDIDCHDPNESDCTNRYFVYYWDELDIIGGAIYLHNDLTTISMGSIIHDEKGVLYLKS